MGLVISKGLTLKSYNTPAAIAGVAPTLDYRFALDRREIEAISLTDKLAYTGATNGTFVNRAGLIERATTDQPRFDHGTLSRQSLGLLVEEQRGNLLLQSEQINQSPWTLTLASVAAETSVLPNGDNNAYKLVPDIGIGAGLCRQNPTLADNTVYTISIFAKAAGFSQFFIQLFDKAGTFAQSRTIDLSAGGLSGSETGSSITSVVNYGNGWYRLILANVNSLSGVTTPNVRFRIQGTGDGTSGIYFWGAQLEAGASPTSYIPTTTTALTRPVDSAVIDGTGVITGTYTLVEKPAGCAAVNGTNIDLVSGFTAERVMVFPAALSAPQITAIRGAM
jgi:hypothetical protein